MQRFAIAGRWLTALLSYLFWMTLAVTCCEYFEYACETLTHDAILCDCVWFEYQASCCEIDHIGNVLLML